MNKGNILLSGLAHNIILEVIDFAILPKNTTRGRKPKQSNSEYLNDIFYVLKTGCAWNDLKSKVTGDAVRKKFTLWSGFNIFHISWHIVLDIYSTFNQDLENLYIDASHIKNILGREEIGSNHYDRFRNATKLSIITDKNGVPVSITLCKSNTHDIKMMDKLLENIKVDLDNTANLVADKGYISDKKSKEIYKKYAIKLITPFRKNKKNKKDTPHSETNKQLKMRYIVEHSFGWLKSYKRIRNRYDHKINIFESFIIFASINLTSRKIIKLM